MNVQSKKEKINLYWFKHDEKHGNFGDELNPYIVKALTGIEPTHVDIFTLPNNKIVLFKSLFKNILKGNLNSFFRREYWISLTNQKVILGIGSVIGWYRSPNIIVWGSGIIHTNTKIMPGDFRAVRGFHTLEKLKNFGYNIENTALGDPGLLLPLIFKKRINDLKYKVGIIPHYIHYNKVKNQIGNNENVLVINLLDPIEEILKGIMKCEMTLSTSLHGVIVSHAYEIPSLWISLKNINLENLAGDDIKFADYFSSITITEYLPISISLPLDFEKISRLRTDCAEICLPNRNKVYEIQKGLLRNAPFKIKDKFLKGIV